MSHPDPGEGCYGCWDRSGYRCTHDSYFTDSRTSRKFCHECTAALVTWELDGSPEPDDGPYSDWIEEETAKPQNPEYIAVYGHGSWGGQSKYHAADPATYENHRYTARCGQRFMIAASEAKGGHVPFSSLMHLEQCQRCVRFVTKDSERRQQAIEQAKRNPSDPHSAAVLRTALGDDPRGSDA